LTFFELQAPFSLASCSSKLRSIFVHKMEFRLMSIQIPARHFVQRINSLVEMGIGLSILGHPLKALFIVPTRVRFSQSSADRHWA